MTDADLVRQTLAGRNQAYAELIHRWAGRVSALCHARVGCAAAADDLAQDALVQGFAQLKALADPHKFGPWLCRIAMNHCTNYHKAKERTVVPFSTLEANGTGADRPSWEPADHGPADVPDDLDRLRREVSALPEIYRDVVQLFYHEKMSYRDLAELLGVSAATVNARLTKARSLLRERMSQCRP
ncbi:hypothetical protein AYO44_11030 [Planctomycetaceae bacterium SCGC AG-212-F19]|nr:hypothetical protein AYO44_11030 [Planctomycetaceae bacterium SCGC AG-212-F19]